MIKLLFFVLLIWTQDIVYAQECASKYNDIRQPCIDRSLASQKSKNLKINFTKNNYKDLKNKVFFFEGEYLLGVTEKEIESKDDEETKGNSENEKNNESKEVEEDQKNFYTGKLKISTINYTGTSCEVFLKSTYFENNKEHVSDFTLTIVNKFGQWTSDSKFIHRLSGHAITLKAIEVVKNEKPTIECQLDFDEGIHLVDKGKFDDVIDSDKEILMYVGLFLTGLSIFIVAIAIFRDEEKYKASETLEEADERDKDIKKSNDFVLKYSRPFFKRYFSPIVSGMKNKKKIRDKYKRKLASAGLTRELSPEDFFAFKLFLIIGFPIVFLAVRTFLEETWPLTLTPVVGVLGFFYPDYWINTKIDHRRNEVIYHMPFVVDMLALCTEAGLDFIAAMARVNEKAQPSALTEELEILIKETKVGSSRAEALRNLAWRIDTIQISSFTATLIAADSVGASIGPILKTLSVEMRQKRSSDAEKKGATAATKILFPTMFLILPAVFIMIFAPMIMQFMG